MNNEYLQDKEILDRRLNVLVQDFLPGDNILSAAMAYGVTAPGKRIRGALTLAFCRRFSVPEEQAIPFAEALELIHAYSLVHDDMPEMDNDDYRRGQLTCHKKFDAATALLAGDGMLNLSMEYLLSKRKLYQPHRFLDALEVLYFAAGAQGMLHGQALDKSGEKRTLSLDELLKLHRAKTGQLLLAPILIAQALSGINDDNYVNYSKHIGLAFQIKDDILDVEGSGDMLGKEPGKDAAEHKSTFVSILGLNEAKKHLDLEIDAAVRAAGEDEFLLWLAHYIKNREK
ncbi:MAG: polyprenyl synthetase family protein [Clostridia bacterium]|nr:polyprenyl synthetase family protein [Clostridia bacterium]